TVAPACSRRIPRSMTAWRRCRNMQVEPTWRALRAEKPAALGRSGYGQILPQEMRGRRWPIADALVEAARVEAVDPCVQRDARQPIEAGQSSASTISSLPIPGCGLLLPRRESAP